MKVLIASDFLDMSNVEVVRLKVLDKKKFKGEDVVEERKRIGAFDGFVTVGEPTEEVVKFANAVDVDLIAVSEPELGLDVAKMVSKPVVIARDLNNIFERGLLGYNPLVFNEVTKTRIESLPFDELHLVHVLESLLPTKVSNLNFSKISRFMECVKESVSKVSHYHVRIGEPVEEILKTAEEIDASCIALNTSVKTLPIGSTVKKIVKSGRFPVLIWRDLIDRNGFIQMFQA
ncbi:universal stress protein [Archaeoglobus sp.]